MRPTKEQLIWGICVFFAIIIFSLIYLFACSEKPHKCYYCDRTGKYPMTNLDTGEEAHFCEKHYKEFEENGGLLMPK